MRSAHALPVTEAVAEAMVSLPVHHRLTEAEVAEIADAVIAAVGRATTASGTTAAPGGAPPMSRSLAGALASPHAAAVPEPVGDR
jgi:perosamine synthetase